MGEVEELIECSTKGSCSLQLVSKGHRIGELTEPFPNQGTSYAAIRELSYRAECLERFSFLIIWRIK